ncbi:competence protein ComEA [Anaerobacterium chartisolvens]|uniref:Competence protein ComEA n=1 Tax=Anaerobacterium chartisolvens TaxID=1297424 RepID=A0A369B8J8_9FIRM|nr:ComEA family DNA-binding protein [Anaerobacterium chartisolvens]RCX16918.1 competence protein ComEA [Anaerobacterium chartisolvens]
MELNILGRQIYIKKQLVVIAAAVIVLAAVVAGFMIRKNDKGIIIDRQGVYGPQENVQQQTALQKEQEEREEDDLKEEIKVYVVGCVKKAGVVTLRKGQIIDDAIIAAGGFTDEADMENINLAYRLEDNTMIKVLSKKDTEKINEDIKSPAPKAPLGTKPGVIITKDSGGAVVNPEGEKSKASAKININTADSAELDKLPGVGEKTAGDIISYREKNGSFKRPEDIMNVPGIGQSKFARMKDLIVAD